MGDEDGKVNLKEMQDLEERIEFMSGKNNLRGLVVKPRDFNPNKKYPLVVFSTGYLSEFRRTSLPLARLLRDLGGEVVSLVYDKSYHGKSFDGEEGFLHQFDHNQFVRDLQMAIATGKSLPFVADNDMRLFASSGGSVEALEVVVQDALFRKIHGIEEPLVNKVVLASPMAAPIISLRNYHGWKEWVSKHVLKTIYSFGSVLAKNYALKDRVLGKLGAILSWLPGFTAVGGHIYIKAKMLPLESYDRIKHIDLSRLVEAYKDCLDGVDISVVYGRKDRVTSTDQMQRLFAAITRGPEDNFKTDFIIIYRTGHDLLAYPDEVDLKGSGFLDGRLCKLRPDDKPDKIYHPVALQNVFECLAERKITGRNMVVVAHNDDEYFIAGTMAQWARDGEDVSYVCVTNGDCHGHELRNVQSDIVLKLLGVIKGNETGTHLGYSEVGVLEAIKSGNTNIVGQMINSLLEQFREKEPTRVVTTAYEGGSIYHDLVNFCTLEAVEQYERETGQQVELLEMPQYHLGENKEIPTVGKFSTDGFDYIHTLEDDLAMLKIDEGPKGILHWYWTEQETIAGLKRAAGDVETLARTELFRLVPRDRDYSRLPNPSPLYYEARKIATFEDFSTFIQKYQEARHAVLAEQS